MLVHATKRMIEVFRAFNQDAAHPFPYPPDNECIFEQWYCQQFKEEDARERIYLPIYWTGYYVRNQYGKDTAAIKHLQGYLNNLDKSKKYYTICQYDDGILNDLSGLDIRVYSMSGEPMDVALPLICPPHKVSFEVERDIFMCFVGRLTHPLRNKLIEQYGKDPECYVTSRAHSIEEYCKVMARSVFALCPRGYGPTSFRVAEALQFGTIPIYISDKMILPYNAGFPGGICHYEQEEYPNDVKGYLKSVQPLIKNIVRDIPEIYTELFTYEGCKRVILLDLEDENNRNNKTRTN